MRKQNKRIIINYIDMKMSPKVAQNFKFTNITKLKFTVTILYMNTSPLACQIFLTSNTNVFLITTKFSYTATLFEMSHKKLILFNYCML